MIQNTKPEMCIFCEWSLSHVGTAHSACTRSSTDFRHRGRPRSYIRDVRQQHVQTYTCGFVRCITRKFPGEFGVDRNMISYQTRTRIIFYLTSGLPAVPNRQGFPVATSVSYIELAEFPCDLFSRQACRLEGAVFLLWPITKQSRTPQPISRRDGLVVAATIMTNTPSPRAQSVQHRGFE